MRMGEIADRPTLPHRGIRFLTWIDILPAGILNRIGVQSKPPFGKSEYPKSRRLNISLQSNIQHPSWKNVGWVLTTVLTITGFGVHGDSGDEGFKEQLFWNKRCQKGAEKLEKSSASYLEPGCREWRETRKIQSQYASGILRPRRRCKRVSPLKILSILKTAVTLRLNIRSP